MEPMDYSVFWEDIRPYAPQPLVVPKGTSGFTVLDRKVYFTPEGVEVDPFEYRRCTSYSLSLRQISLKQLRLAVKERMPTRYNTCVGLYNQHRAYSKHGLGLCYFRLDPCGYGPLTRLQTASRNLNFALRSLERQVCLHQVLRWHVYTPVGGLGGCSPESNGEYRCELCGLRFPHEDNVPLSREFPYCPFVARRTADLLNPVHTPVPWDMRFIFGSPLVSFEQLRPLLLEWNAAYEAAPGTGHPLDYSADTYVPYQLYNSPAGLYDQLYQ